MKALVIYDTSYGNTSLIADAIAKGLGDATTIGIVLAWILTLLLLDVDFSVNMITLAAVDLGAIAITGLLGATTILRPLSSRSARFLRELSAE